MASKPLPRIETSIEAAKRLGITHGQMIARVKKGTFGMFGGVYVLIHPRDGETAVDVFGELAALRRGL